ncbi:MAG: hypothetical protein DMF97_10250, partial [Acidobacteria bacterium]
GFAPAIRRAAGILLAWFTVSALSSPTVPIIAKAILAAVFAATVWNPGEGLLLASALAPLGTLIAAIFDIGSFRLTEAVVLAFVAAWLLRPWPHRSEGPAFPAPAATAGWAFGALIAGSVAG